MLLEYPKFDIKGLKCKIVLKGIKIITNTILHVINSINWLITVSVLGLLSF